MKRRRRYIIFIIAGTLLLFAWIKLQSGTFWDGQRRFTIVVASNPVLVLSLEPQTGKAVIFTIPPNTQLETPFEYGAYPAQSVYHLGELDPKRGGGKLLSKAVENTFGIWTDGFLAFRDNMTLPADFTAQIPQIKKQYFSLFGIFSNLSKYFFWKGKMVSNLSFLDQINLWLALRNTRPDNIIVLDFEERGVLKDNIFPDGSTVKTIDTELASLVLADYFEDRQIRMENISLEIENASGIDRLATQFAQILTNLGGSVMVKSTADTQGNFSCNLHLSDKILKDSMIVKRLVTYYHCQIKNEMEEKGTVQLRMVLGKEFYQ